MTPRIIKFGDKNKATAYYVGNKLHREDGPALIFENGNTIWCFNGENISYEVSSWLFERSIDENNMTEEDKLALTFFMRSLQ